MDKNENNTLSINILTKDELKGTWFVEIQPIKSSDFWNNRHWASESIYMIPEHIELFAQEIYQIKKNFSFYNENRMSINEEIRFVKELTKTLTLIKKMSDKDFSLWIKNNKFSENIMSSINLITKSCIKNLHTSIIDFVEKIIIYIEERISRNEDIIIIGV